MDTPYHSVNLHWQDWVNLLLGLWLVASPWALDFTGVPHAGGTAVILGLVIAVIASWALVQFERWEEWVSIVLGLLLIVTPWLVGFAAMEASPGAESASTATWNFVVVGVLVGGSAIWSMCRTGDQ